MMDRIAEIMDWLADCSFQHGAPVEINRVWADGNTIFVEVRFPPRGAYDNARLETRNFI